ncbi:MAG: hypothetical protein JWQ44_1980 [Chthoniobacter sp.]|nr:hypothetical protein [Chthoniobacter sp.]
MKNTLLLITTVAALAASAFAHERITIGPKGGRVIYLDSPTVPNVEFAVNKDGRAEVALLDKDRKPIALTGQNIIVTAGPRASAKKLTVEKQGDTFLTEPLPAGAPYTTVIQIKETPAAKALTARVEYDPTPAKSGKPAYLDDSVNESSGPDIQVPDSLEGIFGLINQHHGELNQNFTQKKYEALDEVTQAFPVLLKALPAKAGNKQAVVQTQVDGLVKNLTAIAQANAARALPSARADLESFQTGLVTLKKNFPDKVANAAPPE